MESLCFQCGYNLQGCPATVCPECGTSIDATTRYRSEIVRFSIIMAAVPSMMFFVPAIVSYVKCLYVTGSDYQYVTYSGTSVVALRVLDWTARVAFVMACVCLCTTARGRLVGLRHRLAICVAIGMLVAECTYMSCQLYTVLF